MLAAGTQDYVGQAGRRPPAPSLWLAGAVGLAFGIGYYAIAGLATLVVLIILLIARMVETLMPTASTRPRRPTSTPGPDLQWSGVAAPE